MLFDLLNSRGFYSFPEAGENWNDLMGGPFSLIVIDSIEEVVVLCYLIWSFTFLPPFSEGLLDPD